MKIKSLLIIAVAIFLVSGAALLWHRDAKFMAQTQAFERVSRDDTKQSVERLLGRPDHIASCGEQLSWNDGEYFKNDGRCVESWSYMGRPLVRYEVSFDTHGKVIAKYPFVSE